MSIESKLEKLNASNYSSWKLVMTSLLKSKGLWKFCTEEVDMTKEELMMKSEEAKTLMYSTMDNSQVIATGTCIDSYDLWAKIKENHEGAEKHLMNNALAAFLGFKYVKGENLLDYCGRYETVLGALSSTKKPVDESTKIWVFRNTLPKELKTIVNTWSMANSDGKVNDLISQLKVQYHLDKREGTDTQAVALYSGEKTFTGQPHSRQKATGNGHTSQSNDNRHKNKQGKVSSSSNNKNSNNSQNQPVTCTYCKKQYHTWQNCRKLKADNQRKKRFASKPNSSDDQCAFMAHEQVTGWDVMLEHHTWIIDSGATSHMTPNKMFLTDYIKYEEPKKIVVGTGKVAEAYGEGTYFFTNEGLSSKLLAVMWVPQLNSNLFSLGRALSMGYEVRFKTDSKQVLFLLNDKPKLVGYGTPTNLFFLNLIQCEPPFEDSSEMALLGASLADWHLRLAHIGIDSVKELSKSGAVEGMKIENGHKLECQHCIMGKMSKCSHPSSSGAYASEQTAILHIDTVGPISVDSLGGSKYFVLATEEYSGYRLIQFVASKNEIADRVKLMINQVELEAKRPVKMIRTDNGTEYKNKTLDDWLSDRGIIHDFSAPYTPEQNGRAERSNRTIIEAVRTLLSDSGLPESLWAEAANTAVYVQNRTLSTKDRTKTRFELYADRKPNVSHLRRFGQGVIVHKQSHQRDSKWSEKGILAVFVGYTKRVNTYRLYDGSTNLILTSCDVRFLNEPSTDLQKVIKKHKSTNDNHFTIHHEHFTNEPRLTPQPASQTPIVECMNPPDEYNSGDNESFITSNSNSETHQTGNNSTIVPSDNDTNVDVLNASDATSIYQYETFSSPPRSRPATRSESRRSNLDFVRDLSIPNWFWGRGSPRPRPRTNQHTALSSFALIDEPRTYKDAMAGADRDKWQEAMDEELNALNKNQTWRLVPKPQNVKPIKSKWVYKVKINQNGSIDRYKARLVAKGYSQIENVDYKETFAPTASMNTIRILFGIANQNDMEIMQFDIKTAFLYGDLDETLYMEYPEGYPNPDNQVCKLLKSLYGLKQAPRQWNIKFDNFLKEFKLNRSAVDKCLYYNEDRTLLLVIYVDDGLVASTDRKLLKELINYLKQNFDLKVMKCEAYLGFKVTRNRQERTLALSQTHYIDKVLEKFGMADCKPASTPEEVISGSQSTIEQMPLTEDYPFKELVGSLLYLITCTRPDIAHAVSIASRTSTPTTIHWQQLKRVLRYLKGTRDLGICFRWEKSPELVGYSDADYANDVETRRSTTGFCINYGSTPVVWRCQRQAIVSLSTTEAEYISGCDLVKELLPIREMMIELKQIEDKPTTVFIDNQSTVKIAKEERGQQRTKHIDVRQKWLSEQHQKGKIDVKHIRGDEQAADMLTKPLHKTKFVKNRSLLMATIAMLAMISTVSCYTFAKVGPLHFKPTKYQFFNGDLEYKLKLIMMNPCKKFFSGIADKDYMLEELVNDCNEAFNAKVTNTLKNCKLESTNNEVYELPSKNSTVTSLSRPKRFAPLLAIGLLAVAGLTAHATIQSDVNRRNIDLLTDLRNRERALLDDGMDLFSEIRNSIHDVQRWSTEVDIKLNKHKHLQGILPKLAALVHHYEHMFDEYKSIVKEIDIEAQKQRISTVIRTISNETLWDEPAAEWSTLYNCSHRIQNNSLAINLHFNVPLRDPRIKVMEAVAINFYNQTVTPEGKPTICWMKYKGPRFILLNTTTTCMAELIDWNTDDGYVRSQYCASKEDEIKDEGNIWEKESCSGNPQATKRRIQDREYGGLHRIYCYPYNISVENTTYPCPDYVFELEGRTTYKIANLEHYGHYFEKSFEIKPSDHLANREILTQLKMDKYEITPINLTKLDKAHDTYFAKLQLLPKNITLAQADWINSPVKMVHSVVDTIKGYIETIGIILAVLAGVFVLIVLAPVLELVLLGYGFLKIITKTWLNSAQRLAEIFKLKKRVQKNYWDHDHKMV